MKTITFAIFMLSHAFSNAGDERKFGVVKIHDLKGSENAGFANPAKSGSFDFSKSEAGADCSLTIGEDGRVTCKTASGELEFWLKNRCYVDSLINSDANGIYIMIWKKGEHYGASSAFLINISASKLTWVAMCTRYPESGLAIYRLLPKWNNGRARAECRIGEKIYVYEEGFVDLNSLKTLAKGLEDVPNE